MLRDALAAPTRTQDAATTVFMGGVLTLVTLAAPVVWLLAVATTPLGLLLTPLFVLPPLVLRGYDVRVVRTGLAGDRATPSFVDWSRLVRDGVQATVLDVVYALPLVGFVAVGGGSVLLLGSGVVSPNTAVGVGAALGIVVAAVGTVGYGALYLYLRPAAVAVFASEGRLRDAFAVRTVLGVAGSGGYVKGWLLAVATLTVGVAVGLPTTATLVGVVVLFYARVVAGVLYGRGASDVLTTADEKPEREPLADRPPAEVAPAVQTGRTVAAVASEGRTASSVAVAGDGRGREESEDSTPFSWVDVDESGDGRRGE